VVSTSNPLLVQALWEPPKLIIIGLQTGTGSFEATEGPTITLTSSTSTRRAVSTTTIEVYVSYCPDPALVSGLMRLGQNFSSSGAGGYREPDTPSFNISSISNSSSPVMNTTSSSDGDSYDPCNVCPNSVGLCCPPGVPCDEDGKCPWYAIERSSQSINGYLIAQVMNSTAPVAGRKKVRALPKKKLSEITGRKSGGGSAKDKNRRRVQREF